MHEKATPFIINQLVHEIQHKVYNNVEIHWNTTESGCLDVSPKEGPATIDITAIRHLFNDAVIAPMIALPDSNDDRPLVAVIGFYQSYNIMVRLFAK